MSAWVVAELGAPLARSAQDLLLRHDLRSGDALQLATCLFLQRETGRRVPFLGFDDRLSEAARAEGLSLFSLVSAGPDEARLS